jgi:tetratricopeptide (TPR) repeat protein
MLAARAMSKDGASGDGRWGKARRLFRLASQSLPEDAESLFEVAATFDRQDNLGGARAAYLKVLEGHPDHAPTLFRLGLLEYDDRKEARAKELLTKFLDLQAKGPDAKRAREVLKRIK